MGVSKVGSKAGLMVGLMAGLSAVPWVVSRASMLVGKLVA